jgi:putative OPT family oligopeptide transporter
MASPSDRPALRRLTLRAALTGMGLGAVLTLCNIYTGLKVGWGTNMSITSVLLAYALWSVFTRFGSSEFDIFENNQNQTAASAAASISSAGLVSAMPALTLLTGQKLGYPLLALWVGSIAMLGVLVGVALRKQLVITEKLAFPFGVATHETLHEIYARGTEALARVRALLLAGGAGALLKGLEELLKLPKLAVPGSVGNASLKNLGFALEPSVLMLGLGSLIGLRACLSVLLGALVAWGVIAPELLARGLVEPGKPGDFWFARIVPWLLWPGVGLMVSSALGSFALSGGAIVRSFRRKPGTSSDEPVSPPGFELRGRRLVVGFMLVSGVVIALQLLVFHISLQAALFGLALTFVLAIVAGRVAGETGITPVGPMGKVTQLALGVAAPGDATANLMAANVTGGAASLTADMLQDMKTGQLLGAWPRPLAHAQLLGAIAGALAGSAAYLVLLPDPKRMLFTTEWPAPAVAQWKAVAELFQKGFSSMPAGAFQAFLIGGAVGTVLVLAEKLSPEKVRRFLPSAASVGLAFVVPAYNSVGIVLGGVLVALGNRFFPKWTGRFASVVACGLIAGESLAGVGFAIRRMLVG